MKTISVPPDKSLSHRALIFASLAEGVSEIKNVLMSEDVKTTIRILQQLGVKIVGANPRIRPHVGAIHPSTILRTSELPLQIHGVGLKGYKPTDEILDCGNSGTTMRLMLGVLAGQGIAARLTGDDSLNRRPMDRVIAPLRKMGANIDVVFENGRRVILLSPHPGLRPFSYRLSVASAQVKTALLLAGLTAGVEVTLEEPMPSRNHTELLLQQQGMVIGHPIGPGIFLKPLYFNIPGDFSSAAFFIVLALLNGAHGDVPLQIQNVGLNPTRTGLLDVLKRMGAEIEVLYSEKCRDPRGGWCRGEPLCSPCLGQAQGSAPTKKIATPNMTLMGDTFQEIYGDLHIKPSRLKNTTVAPHEIPFLIDEIPILALAASFAEGEFVLSGAEELRVKESDRIHAICTELKKLGVDITEKQDGFVINVGAGSQPARKYRAGLEPAPTKINFSSHGDHRIAMMLVIAGKILGHDLAIDDTDCIDTSFPGFFNLLEGPSEKHHLLGSCSGSLFFS